MPSRQETDPNTPEKFFQVAGKSVLLEGTSGVPATPARAAEGTYVRHDLVVGGRIMSSAGTSGPSRIPLRFAEGRPNQLAQRTASVKPQTAAALRGSGAAIGGPVHRG